MRKKRSKQAYDGAAATTTRNALNANQLRDSEANGMNCCLMLSHAVRFGLFSKNGAVRGSRLRTHHLESALKYRLLFESSTRTLVIPENRRRLPRNNERKFLKRIHTIEHCTDGRQTAVASAAALSGLVRSLENERNRTFNIQEIKMLRSKPPLSFAESK